ncbi:MAG: oligosaccharide flippase family protein [Bacteroidales bacterium]|nr:oligosaccharide flippase family protein [Bacteroidales bacterium]
MKRKFITNLALVIFLNLLVKPFWIFGIDRNVQNMVGAESYGLYFSLFSFSLLLNILLDVGITNFNNRAIAREPSLLSEYFSNIIGLKFLLAVFYAIFCLVTGLIVGYDTIQLKILIFLIINQFLASFLLYLRSNISGLHLFRTDSIISVLDRALVIVICSVLLWGGVTDQVFKIEWFVYAQTVAYAITVLVAFMIVMSKSEYLKPRLDIKYLAGVIKKSYPFALLILLMSFYNRIDSVMLERILPEGNMYAGMYAQSFRILDAAAMFAFLFAGLLLPIFSRMIKQDQPVNEMIRLSFSLIIIPALTLAVLAFFYSTEIIDWMYNEKTTESARIFPLLMFGFIAISTTYIFGTLLTANGSLLELNLLATSAVILNVVLNFILIPRLQAYGAAISSLITQSYMALFQVIISVIKFKFSLNPGYLIQLIIFPAGIFGAGYLIDHYLQNWLRGALLLICFAVLLAFSIRLVKISEIYKILRKEGAEE